MLRRLHQLFPACRLRLCSLLQKRAYWRPPWRHCGQRSKLGWGQLVLCSEFFYLLWRLYSSFYNIEYWLHGVPGMDLKFLLYSSGHFLFIEWNSVEVAHCCISNGAISLSIVQLGDLYTVSVRRDPIRVINLGISLLKHSGLHGWRLLSLAFWN